MSTSTKDPAHKEPVLPAHDAGIPQEARATPASSATEFTLFWALPFEVRANIWGQAVYSGPRIIYVHAIFHLGPTFRPSEEPGDPPEEHFSLEGGYLYQHNILVDKPHSAAPGPGNAAHVEERPEFIMPTQTAARNSAISLVCREARYEFYRFFPLDLCVMSENSSTRLMVPWNPNNDIIAFRSVSYWHIEDLPPSAPPWAQPLSEEQCNDFFRQLATIRLLGLVKVPDNWDAQPTLTAYHLALLEQEARMRSPWLMALTGVQRVCNFLVSEVSTIDPLRQFVRWELADACADIFRSNPLSHDDIDWYFELLHILRAINHARHEFQDAREHLNLGIPEFFVGGRLAIQTVVKHN
jgi:hypothetical protein